MDDKIRKIQEGIDALLSLQRRFQEEHGFDFWKENPEKKRDMFIGISCNHIGVYLAHGLGYGVVACQRNCFSFSRHDITS